MKLKVENLLKSLFSNHRNKIILALCLLVAALLVTFTFSINMSEEAIENIEIESSGWSAKESGSWHINKSAKWIDSNMAEIKFSVTSEMKLADESKDIILILDTSESMASEKVIEGVRQTKIARMKADAVALTQKVLSRSDNRIALVEFNTKAKILSDFTNSSSTIVNKINSLGAYGATNYRDALSKANDILTDTNYKETEGRDLVILFLSDGIPIIETTNHIGEYEALKLKYPKMIAHAVQYEMGNEVVQELVDISDRQYLAYVENLKNMLFEASTAFKFYDEFDVTDFIKTDNFQVNSAGDIKVSNGTFEFDKDNQKIIWKLGSYNPSEYSGTYMSGSEATMTIKAELKDTHKNTYGLFDTNEKESVISRLYNEDRQTINSSKTPVLYNGYEVIYDTNPPTGCTISATESEVHPIFEVVKLRKNDLVCSGYQFKGWQIAEADEEYLSNTEYVKGKVYKINDSSFKMPSRNIHVRAAWTKLDIKKSMSGTLSEGRKVLLIDQIKKAGIDSSLNRIPIDNEKSTYVTATTGIDFVQASGDTNGKGLYIRAGSQNDTNPIYYYRGAVTNNNVLFADYCWKIVRTTETGGIKLVYNGAPVNGQCKTTVNSQGINNGSVYNFNPNLYKTTLSQPMAFNGYMYGEVYNNLLKRISDTDEEILKRQKINTDAQYYYTKEIPTWNGSKYVLSENLDSSGISSFVDIWENARTKLTNGGYYTCLSATVGGSCVSVYYIFKADSNYIYYFNLSNNSTIYNEDEIITLGSGIIDNNNETYTLTGITTIKKSEWYTNHSKYKNYYICSDFTSTTCDSFKMYYITATTNLDFDWTVAREIVFANDVEYNNGIYTLKDTIVKKNNMEWLTYPFPYTQKHYTCLNKETSCEKVYYVFRNYGNDGMLFSITLDGAKNVDDAISRMFTNTTNSEVKIQIDDWYKKNIEEKTNKNNKKYSTYLENTVWCNDKSISIYHSWNKDTSNWFYYDGLYYGAYGNRNLGQNKLQNPGLKDVDACPNIMDRFTLNDDKGNGNGSLTYPIGLLTADEVTVAGNGNPGYSLDTYLYENVSLSFWTLTPYEYYTNASNTIAYVYSVDSSGKLTHSTIAEYFDFQRENGARVAISLKPDTMVLESGDGTADRPYVVR